MEMEQVNAAGASDGWGAGLAVGAGAASGLGVGDTDGEVDADASGVGDVDIVGVGTADTEGDGSGLGKVSPPSGAPPMRQSNTASKTATATAPATKAIRFQFFKRSSSFAYKNRAAQYTGGADAV